MQLIPGKLYFLKDSDFSKKLLIRNVFGYQYAQLKNYFINNNTLMFIKVSKLEHRISYNEKGMMIKVSNNIYKTNLYYTFLGCSTAYTFVFKPEDTQILKEQFIE